MTPTLGAILFTLSQYFQYQNVKLVSIMIRNLSLPACVYVCAAILETMAAETLDL